MNLSHIRRDLRTHPRAVQIVLLAFAIHILPPPSVFVSHHHAGGALAHTHSGRIAGSAPIVVVTNDTLPAATVGLQHAPASDLHRHVAQPLISIADPGGVPAGPVMLITAVAPALAQVATPLTARPGQARSPPSRVA